MLARMMSIEIMTTAMGDLDCTLADCFLLDDLTIFLVTFFIKLVLNI
jgi:hypothetical protein